MSPSRDKHHSNIDIAARAGNAKNNDQTPNNYLESTRTMGFIGALRKKRVQAPKSKPESTNQVGSGISIQKKIQFSSHLPKHSLKSTPMLSHGESVNDLTRELSSESMFWVSCENNDLLLSNSESFSSVHTAQEVIVADSSEDEPLTIPVVQNIAADPNLDPFQKAEIPTPNHAAIEPGSKASIPTSLADSNDSTSNQSKLSRPSSLGNPIRTQLFDQSSKITCETIELKSKPDPRPRMELVKKLISGFASAAITEFVGSAWELAQSGQNYNMSAWSLKFINPQIENKYRTYELRVLQFPIRILIAGMVIPLLSQVYISEICIVSYKVILQDCSDVSGSCLACQNISTRILALNGVWLIAIFVLACLPAKNRFRPKLKKLWISSIVAFSTAAMCNITNALCPSFCFSIEDPALTFFDRPLSPSSTCVAGSSPQSPSADVRSALSWLNALHQYWITSISVYIYLIAAAASLSIRHALVLGIAFILFAAILGYIGDRTISPLLSILIVNMLEALAKSIFATYQRELLSRASFRMNIRNAKAKALVKKQPIITPKDLDAKHEFGSTLTHVSPSSVIATMRKANLTIAEAIHEECHQNSNLKGERDKNATLQYSSLLQKRLANLNAKNRKNMQGILSDQRNKTGLAEKQACDLNATQISLQQLTTLPRNNYLGDSKGEVTFNSLSDTSTSKSLSSPPLDEAADLPLKVNVPTMPRQLNPRLNSSQWDTDKKVGTLSSMGQTTQVLPSITSLGPNWEMRNVPYRGQNSTLSTCHPIQSRSEETETSVSTASFNTEFKSTFKTNEHGTNLAQLPFFINSERHPANYSSQMKISKLNISEQLPWPSNQLPNIGSAADITSSQKVINHPNGVYPHHLRSENEEGTKCVVKMPSRSGSAPSKPKSVNVTRGLLRKLFYRFPSPKDEVKYLDYSWQRLRSRLRLTAISNGFVTIILALFKLGPGVGESQNLPKSAPVLNWVLMQWWFLHAQTAIISVICLIGLGRFRGRKLESFTVILGCLMVLLAIAYDGWVRSVVPNSTLIHSSNPNVIAIFASVTTIRLRPRMHIYIVVVMVLASIASAMTVQIVGMTYTQREVTVQFGVILGAIIVSMTLSLLFEASQRRYYFLLQLEKGVGIINKHIKVDEHSILK